jgi:hypothetical protein
METGMNALQLATNRFSRPPVVLAAETEILGVTAAEWTAMWTGGFLHTFHELEERQKLFESNQAPPEATL